MLGEVPVTFHQVIFYNWGKKARHVHYFETTDFMREMQFLPPTTYEHIAGSE